MEVTELSVNTFWKGEMELKGTVKENGERYRVRILSKGSQIYDYSCSHVDQNGKKLDVCSMGCACRSTWFPDGVQSGAAEFRDKNGGFRKRAVSSCESLV